MFESIIEELAIKAIEQQEIEKSEYSQLIKCINANLPIEYRPLTYELEAILTKLQCESELRMFKEGFKTGLNMGVKSILQNNK